MVVMVMVMITMILVNVNRDGKGKMSQIAGGFSFLPYVFSLFADVRRHNSVPLSSESQQLFSLRERALLCQRFLFFYGT